MRTFNLADLFDEVAEAVPDRQAVVVGNLRTTYRQLAERVTWLASWMHARGIGDGDTVGLQLYNGIEYLEAYLAACKIRAAPVNINYRYVAEELRYLCENSGLKALVYSADLGPRVHEALAAAPDPKVIVRVYALTGDIARREEDGSILVFGRDSNCINSGGEKVFAEEVEEALRRHPSVFDCLVVGLPDPRWGSKVVGVVARRPRATTDREDLRSHCRQHLSGYKVPKDVVFGDAVRRSAAGKGDYRWALQTAGQALA